MAVDGWVAVADEDGSARAAADRIAVEVSVPGLRLSRAKVLARALSIGLEEIDADHSRLLPAGPKRSKAKKRPGPVKAPTT